MNKPEEGTVPKAMHAIFEEIVARTDAVSKEHLDDEYAQMCRKLAAALSRKRPSPLLSGKSATWACGIAYTIGFVNFLSDNSSEPYMKMEDLCRAFGVSSSAGAGKAKTIRELFNIHRFEPDWCLPSRLDGNPLVWMVTVNGLFVDIRHMPREVQEEALRKKIIPYIPE